MQFYACFIASLYPRKRVCVCYFFISFLYQQESYANPLLKSNCQHATELHRRSSLSVFHLPWFPLQSTKFFKHLFIISMYNENARFICNDKIIYYFNIQSGYIAIYKVSQTIPISFWIHTRTFTHPPVPPR